MMKLGNFVRVYVCVESQVETVVRTMCAEFGGATVTKSEGYWMDDQGHLHIDQTTLVTSFTEFPVVASTVAPIVQSLFVETEEKAISVETSLEGLTIFDRSDFTARIERDARDRVLSIDMDTVEALINEMFE